MGKTVKVTFENHVMMFGDSYKPWHMQFDEYLWLYRDKSTALKILKVEMSHSKWVSWGGLKWCPEARFQNQLNREHCQANEPDNPKPRIYSKMNFKEDAATTRKAMQLFEKYEVRTL